MTNPYPTHPKLKRVGKESILKDRDVWISLQGRNSLNIGELHFYISRYINRFPHNRGDTWSFLGREFEYFDSAPFVYDDNLAVTFALPPSKNTESTFEQYFFPMTWIKIGGKDWKGKNIIFR